MSQPSSPRDGAGVTDSWVGRHPIGRALLAVAIPGGVYAIATLTIGDESVRSAILMGIGFGVAFAAVRLVLRQALGD